MIIDTKFDFRSDSKGRDPDLYSPSLKLYHQYLWSKSLPSGAKLNLETESGHYLLHRSKLELFSLSSDTISNSQRARKSMKPIIDSIPLADLDSFQALGSTVGARILFPGKKKNGRLTINVARGLNNKIVDRFDLTLECIRLQYLGVDNPLRETLETYWSFFELFEDFDGYVQFFLLQDLVDGGQVRFFLPFGEGFTNPSLPVSIEDYALYRSNTMDFVSARNERIKSWVALNL